MHRPHRSLALSLLVALSLLPLAGCQKHLRPNQVADASAAYQAGDYRRAYKQAVAVASTPGAPSRDAGALVAGLAAQELRAWDDAERLLLQAAFSDDPAIAGDALASLGLMYAQLERYAESAQALLKAAPRLTGQNRANAYFFAGIAQQKLGQSAQARTNFFLARNASDDPAFHEQVETQLAVVGYTLQLGAFEDEANALAFAEELASQTTEAELGLPRVVQLSGQARGPLSVVQVGQFSTFASAMQARDRLGINEVVIVPLAGE